MSPRRSRWILTSLAAALGASGLSLGCMRATASAEGTPLAPLPVGPPKLVVFITVDQLRGDLLDRFRRDFRHGHARLMRGAWFVNGFQDHAITETAPGHASTMSGRFPRSTGIMSNARGVGDPRYPLIDGSPNELGASPTNFHGTTLFDWLSAKNSRTRAVSVSMKDRGAILPIGRAKQDVYWYSGNGSFTTSTYYRDTLPTWVRDFNSRRIVQTYAGAVWQLTRELSAYREPDDVPFENGGHDNVFPHRFPSDAAGAASYVRVTPTMDSLTALFALEGVKQTGIGNGPQTDILAVSFSATDVIGHTYGPDSREAHENQIRLDETIGWFLDSLYRLRDSSSIVVALTGDHGVQTNAQLARERRDAVGDQGLVVSLRQQVGAVRAALRRIGVDTMAFIDEEELISVDRATLTRAGVNPDSLLESFAQAARRVPGVARVDRMREIRRADFARDAISRRWAHQVGEDSPVELVITLTRYSTWYRTTATHGSPYDQDAHVPIIFYGPWVKPGRYTNFVRVVDMGTTLAQIAGIRTLERVDGNVLTQALR